MICNQEVASFEELEDAFLAVTGKNRCIHSTVNRLVFLFYLISFISEEDANEVTILLKLVIVLNIDFILLHHELNLDKGGCELSVATYSMKPTRYFLEVKLCNLH